MSLIKINHISKTYQVGEVKTVALNDVSFEIKKGEFVAIIGPSGSGKSTLMNILGALDKPTAGEYILDGQLTSKMSEDELADIRNQKIGFIFQSYNLLPRTSALRNVMVPMMYGGVDKSKRETRAKKYLKLVGLEDRIHHTSNQLSGGQQQRVAIARALIMNPSILLADEPTGNIASTQAEEIMEIFTDLNKQGHTIIMITHDPDIAAYAKKTLVIRDGKLVSNQKNSNRKK